MAIISFACEHGDHTKCPIAGSSIGGPWVCECDCHEPPDDQFDHDAAADGKPFDHVRACDGLNPFGSN